MTQTGPLPGASAGKSSLFLPNPGVVGLELLLAGPRVGVVGRAGAEGFVADGVDVSSGSSGSRVVGLLCFSDRSAFSIGHDHLSLSRT